MTLHHTYCPRCKKLTVHDDGKCIKCGDKH